MIWMIGAALAQDCVVVDGVQAWLPEGRRQVTVIVDHGTIASVGPRPADLRVGDARADWRGRACGLVPGGGKDLTAGLIATSTRLGLVEIDLEGETHDEDAGDPDAIRASTTVAEGYNPRATAIPVSRLGGVTSAVIDPSGGRVAGRSAYVSLAGATNAEAVKRPVVAMRVSLGGSLPGALDDLRQLFDAARRYAAKKAAWGPADIAPDGVTPLDLEALQPVLRGEVPLITGVDRAVDIEGFVRFCQEQKVRGIVDGGAEGWLVAGLLAQAGVPVIVDPYVYGPGSFDQIQGRADNAARLVAAGVTVVISTHDTANARNLRQLAGNAVRGGLDRGAAITAITSAPAAVFGLPERGRIAPGAVADLVLWSGDPLEISTAAERVWIGGVEQPMVSRQTLLRDKYLKGP